MEIRAVLNLYSRDSLYRMSTWLYFLASSAEKRFSLACTRMTLDSKGKSAVLGAVTCLLLLASAKVPLLYSLALALGFVLTGVVPMMGGPSFMMCIVALAPVLWDDIDSSEEALTALMPSFVYFGVLSRNCPKCSTSLALTSFVLLVFHNPPFSTVLASSAALALLSYRIDFDSRSSWAILDSYRRSCRVYLDLFNNNADVILITDAKTEVLCANSKARQLLLEMGADINLPIKLGDVAGRSGESSVKTAVESCIKGQAIEQEVTFMNNAKAKADPFDVFLMKAEPFSWKQANCTKFTLTRISSIGQQRQLMASQTKEVIGSLKFTLKSLRDCLDEEELIRPDDLSRLHGVKLSLCSLLSLQMLGMGTVEMSMTSFNLQRELIDKIELSAQRALAREQEIIFNYEAEPYKVVGDASKTSNFVRVMLEFASKLAKVKSTIMLICGSQASYSQSYTKDETKILLSCSFSSVLINEDDLRFFFQTNNEPISLDKVLKISEQYGFGVASLPLMLKELSGKLVECWMQHDTSSKVFVSFSLPFNRALGQDGAPIKNEAPIQQHKSMIAQFPTPLRTVWKQQSKPIPEILAKFKPKEANRTRYQMKMHRSHSMRVVNKAPALCLADESPVITSFSNLSFPDIEENVKIGKVSPSFAVEADLDNSQHSEMQPIRQRRSRSDFKKSTFEIRRKMNIFSIKNPYRSCESIGIRSNKKKFLAPTEPDSNTLGFEQGPPKVLLVEDNLILRELLYKELCEACLWEPDVVSNGAEAVQKFKDYAELGYKYTAIFMDTTMPVMDGYSAAKRIRALELTNSVNHTHIFGILGKFEASSKERCISAGMDSAGKDYPVFKDINSSELSALIASVQSMSVKPA
jgi:CheY-like chemotaxis protein